MNKELEEAMEFAWKVRDTALEALGDGYEVHARKGHAGALDYVVYGAPKGGVFVSRLTHVTGMGLGDAVNSVVAAARERIVMETGIEEYKDYQRARKHLSLRLANPESDAELLKLTASAPFLDMAVVYTLDMWIEGSQATGYVGKQTVRDWGVGMDELHRDALESMVRNHPATMVGFDEMSGAAGELGIPFGIPTGDGPELYMAQAGGTHYGAAVMLYDGFLKEASRELGGPLLILPSSNIEVIIMRDTGFNVDGIREVVRSVNDTLLDPGDVLSYGVYRYTEGEGLGIC